MQPSLQPPSFEELVAPEMPQEPSVLLSPSVQSSPAVDAASIPQVILQSSLWQTITLWLLPIMLAAMVLLLYSLIRLWQVRRLEEEEFAKQPPSAAVTLLFGDAGATATATTSDHQAYQKRWEHIERYLRNGSVADWRMAIIEADIMLDELLTSWGYAGGSVGEKLKQVSAERLRSIEDAWEAHKLRNKIAHEGSQAQLTEREVRRAMQQYHRVFQEAGLLAS